MTQGAAAISSMRSARRHEVVRSVAAVFGGNLVASVLGAIGGLLVARFLGPEETGRFRYYTIALTYMTVLHLGTFDGLWRQIPFHAGRNAPEKIEAAASSAGAWNFWVSAVASAGFCCLAVYCLWRRDLYGFAGWMTQALTAWFVFYGGYLTATFRTIRQFGTLARIQLVQALLNFAAVFLTPALGFYGLCIRSAAPAVASVALFQRFRPLRVSLRMNRSALGEVVRIGLPFSFWGSVFSSIWFATESSLMLAYGGVTGLGLFSAAFMIREAMNVLPQAVSQVLMPRVVEAFARENSLRRANARSFWPTIALTGTMVILAVVASFAVGYLVPMALPRYTAGIPLIRVCLWFSVVQAGALPLNALLARGDSWAFGRGVIVGAIVFLLMTYLLLPSVGGILAVALGSLAGRAARTIAAYVEIAAMCRREAAG